MEYKAAIFDLDGTIIESNSVWEKLDRIILEQHNLSCSDQFIKKLTAMTYEDAAAELQKIGLNITVQELTDQLNKLAAYEYANNIFLKDGVAEFFDKLKENHIKIALATASPEFLYEPVLKHNKLYDYFDAFVTTYEVGESKDTPAVYLKAAEKVGVSPKECIVFEDVLKGILSAKKAEMFTIGVFDAYSDSKPIIENADKFIYSFTELL